MVRRRRCKSAASSAGTECVESDDESRSVMTELDMTTPDVAELDDNVYDEVDEIIMQATGRDREDICQKAYRRACRSLRITPTTTVLRSLVTNEIILRNHVIGELGTKACAIALLENGLVERLDLEGNAIGINGTFYICEMLKENIFLSDLSLAGNNIGSEGLISVMNLLNTSETLKRVNLSANGLGEEDAQCIADMLQNNTYLEELNLSHNEFREKGGEILGEALVDNTSLEVLDLSWNHLRLAGAEAIAHGIQRNISIRKLDLSWNGFHLEGCRALARALEFNNTLKYLNLTCNRINSTCLDHLLRGLRLNTCLKHLKLARNPVSNDGALSVLDFLIKTRDSELEYISIAGQDVDHDFHDRLEDLREARGDSVTIRYGLTMKQDQFRLIRDEGIFLKEDPAMILMEYMRLKNLRLVDLFHCLDADKSNSLSRDEFRRGLLKSGVPLTDKMLDRLINKLDSNKNGEVEYTELIEGLKEHKRKVLKLLDDVVERNVPFERTEIGRISCKLQAMLRIKEHFWTNKIKRLKYTTRGSTTATSNAMQAISSGALDPFKVAPKSDVSIDKPGVVAAGLRKQGVPKHMEKRPSGVPGAPHRRLLESRVSTLSVIKS